MKSKLSHLLILVFLLILIGYHEHYPIYSNAWVHSGVSYIDPYPNWFIDSFSFWYLDGEKALGAPDNEVALIFYEYGNGYITLDFGRNQEIINGTGPDFTVFAKGGNYLVRIGDNLSRPFEILENGTGGITFNGNQSFDLTGTSYATIRYIQVEVISDIKVELDAAEALNYYQPTPETVLPQIVNFSPEELWVWADQPSVQLSWEVEDLHPWNYSILVNDELVKQGFWTDDSLIEHTLSLTNKSDSVKVDLILDDLFKNRMESTVEIELRPRPSETTIFPILPLLVGIICFSGLKLLTRKVKKLG